MVEDGRDAAGRFGAGNPGRIKGSKNRRPAILQAFDDMAAADAMSVLRSVIAAAQAGDMRAAEIILRRLWPEPRGRALSAEVPGMAEASDLASKIAAVIAAVDDGSVTPEEGRELVTLVEAQRRAHEAIDFERRLQALETAHRERRD